MAYVRMMFLVVVASLLFTELCEGISTTEDPATTPAPETLPPADQTTAGGATGGSVDNTTPAPVPQSNSTAGTDQSGAVETRRLAPAFVLIPLALAKFVIA